MDIGTSNNTVGELIHEFSLHQEWIADRMVVAGVCPTGDQSQWLALYDCWSTLESLFFQDHGRLIGTGGKVSASLPPLKLASWPISGHPLSDHPRPTVSLCAT